jgi:hypothetical protein
MSTSRLPLGLACLAALAHAASAQQATLTLNPDVALRNDSVQAHIVGVGCSGAVSGPVLSYQFSTWIIDIDLEGCHTGNDNQPFDVTVALGPLAPLEYLVRAQDAIRDVVSPPPPPLATATLSVRREASLDVELPARAVAGAPIPITLMGPAGTACYFLEPPTVGGSVITASFDDSCNILPPGGPNVFRETYTLEPLAAGSYEVRFFDTSLTPTGAQPMLHRETLIVQEASGCQPGDDHLCLQRGRFRVEGTWRDFRDRTGSAHPIELPGREDSGLFWFFDPGNVELTVKVLDACRDFDRWWVFVSSGTNVEYALTVTDTETGAVRTYANPLGLAAPLIPDTDAFACD